MTYLREQLNELDDYDARRLIERRLKQLASRADEEKTKAKSMSWTLDVLEWDRKRTFNAFTARLSEVGGHRGSAIM